MSNLITMSCLGRQGRWGNQVFEYTFLRSYARRYDLYHQCNEWVGQRLLGCLNPPIREQLPVYRETIESKSPIHLLNFTFPPSGDEVRGHDFVGYAQFHTSYYSQDRQFIRDLFVLSPEVAERVQPSVADLKSRGKTVIGLHMRRGDTGRLIFYLTPNQWYLRWLEQHWDDYDDPVLFIASEVPEDKEAFAEYNPVTSSDLLSLSDKPYRVYNYLKPDLADPTTTSMDWFPDWYLLTQCDVLVFGNSTFSFSAAMMNHNLQSAWRSRLSTQSFELIDPWNSWSMLREDIRDYPGVADTWYDENPKWEGGETQGRN